jgi:hypothetical protein
MPAHTNRGRTRVVKKLSNTQAGAIKLARRYGAALVCVRYRQDMQGLRRYTTVELVVDEALVTSKKADATIVDLRIAFAEVDLRKKVMAAGASWDPKRRTWRLKYRLVKELGLVDRVVWK